MRKNRRLARPTDPHVFLDLVSPDLLSSNGRDQVVVGCWLWLCRLGDYNTTKQSLTQHHILMHKAGSNYTKSITIIFYFNYISKIKNPLQLLFTSSVNKLIIYKYIISITDKLLILNIYSAFVILYGTYVHEFAYLAYE